MKACERNVLPFYGFSFLLFFWNPFAAFAVFLTLFYRVCPFAVLPCLYDILPFYRFTVLHRFTVFTACRPDEPCKKKTRKDTIRTTTAKSFQLKHVPGGEFDIESPNGWSQVGGDVQLRSLRNSGPLADMNCIELWTCDIKNSTGKNWQIYY